MIKRFLLLFFVSNSLISFNQKELTFNPISLNSSSPHDSFEDLRTLSLNYDSIRLIGMGESTHGTKEFFTMRHRMFKFLVEEKGFNTFFLEADYANCLKINRYINHEQNNLKDAILTIGLWPWVTEEMKDLIEWMKKYNSENTDKKLSFVGCDVQRVSQTVFEIDKIIAKYDANKLDTSLYRALPKNEAEEFLAKFPKKKLDSLIRICANKKKVLLELNNIADHDKISYEILLRHFKQYNDSKSKKYFKDGSFRDKKMAENILYHLKLNPNEKGFFWAHNGHIVNFSHSKRKKYKQVRAGGVLKDTLKEKYHIIFQDFVGEGKFNALKYKGGLKNNRDNYAQNISVCTKIPSNKYLLSEKINLTNEVTYVDLKFLASNNKSGFVKPSVSVNDIGAVFLDDKSSVWYMIYGDMDSIILIKNTTPTKLLD